jgi:hypothetical protein
MLKPNNDHDNRYCAHCMRTTTHRTGNMTMQSTWACIMCGSQKRQHHTLCIILESQKPSLDTLYLQTRFNTVT